MNSTKSKASATESTLDEGIALLAASAATVAFAPSPATELHPGIIDPEDRYLTASSESEFSAYDHIIDEVDGEWTVGLVGVEHRNLSIDEAKRYLAECAAVVRAAEMLPLPAAIAGASK